MSELCRGWNYLSNHTSDDDGRIILLWKSPVQLRLVHESRQSLTCELCLSTAPPFHYTAIYAANTYQERSELWVELTNTCSTLSLCSSPWMIAGDFNEIIHHKEHSNPLVNTAPSPMTEFRNCLHQLGVFDLRFSGSLHTWTNSCPSLPIAKKLDRMLVNSLFLSIFPNAFASFLPPLPSDHCPCLTDIVFQLPQVGTQPFRFSNYLTKHPTFHHVVSLAWAEAGSSAATLSSLCWKCLLQIVQVNSLQNPSPQTFQAERDLHTRWSFLREIEECYFRQKSRINWLAEGDLNTTYFFRICQTRASYNAIRCFILLSGETITDPSAMSSYAITHFSSILGQLPPASTYILSTEAWFHSLTSFRCLPGHAQKMIAIPTGEDIRKLFFKLNANKAPGPDGLTSGFYKASWDILGEEVTASITHFFTNRFLPATANSTILALIPKFPGASRITEFRQIVCLNTIYKVISRLLVTRLKLILVDLIVPNQTAFVKDRLLVENTTLALGVPRLCLLRAGFSL